MGLLHSYVFHVPTLPIVGLSFKQLLRLVVYTFLLSEGTY